MPYGEESLLSAQTQTIQTTQSDSQSHHHCTGDEGEDFRWELTTLEALGEAPFCSKIFTMLRWPINEATCKGVRPDCLKEDRIRQIIKCRSIKSPPLVILFRSVTWVYFISSYSLTSVTASKDAACLSRRSITRMWFFLQAICNGVKPFCQNKGTIIFTMNAKSSFTLFEMTNYVYLSLTSALEFGLAPLSSSSLAMRWWPQCAATCRGVRWSSVMSSISALYCRSCLTQSMWSPCAAMWIGDRPFCKKVQKMCWFSHLMKTYKESRKGSGKFCLASRAKRFTLT